VFSCSLGVAPGPSQPYLLLENMARAGMKRPASKSAGGAHKKRTSAVAKKCSSIAPTIRGAESLPMPVRKIISDRLVHVFGTYKEERHPFQNTVSELVGNTLKATQQNLQHSIQEAQEKKAATEAQGATLGSASEAAGAASDAAAQANSDTKEALAQANSVLKAASSALHDLETAVKTAEHDASAIAAKKALVESTRQDFLVAVREGTLDKGLARLSTHNAGLLSKNVGSSLEREFMVCVARTFSQPASAWRTFDHIVDKELDASLNKILAGLAADIEAMAAAKEGRAVAVEAATAAVTAATGSVHTAEEAHSTASVAAKEAKVAAKTAAATAKQHHHHIDKACDSLNHAERALVVFTQGPLAAYDEVREHTAPPPAPEPEQPEETVAVEAAMAPAPAPAARVAPSILPSPGVLSWVAQASGLARSPQVAQSPRTA